MTVHFNVRESTEKINAADKALFEAQQSVAFFVRNFEDGYDGAEEFDRLTKDIGRAHHEGFLDIATATALCLEAAAKSGLRDQIGGDSAITKIILANFAEMKAYVAELYNQPTNDPEIAVKSWPVMDEGAGYGVIGEMARLATANSEADPIAIMGTALAFAAAHLGRSRFMYVGDSVHHPRHFFALVGASSRARKGTSTAPVKRFFAAAEDAMRANGKLPYGEAMKASDGPLSSGEGLIDAIRDKMADDDEGGTIDKRIVCVEGEFGAPLRAIERQGNTLSTVLRVMWDGATVSPMTKNNKIRATNPHACLVGHITNQELKSLLSNTEIWNGFANRFIWLAVRRSKRVPMPRPMADDDVKRVGEILAEAIAYNHDEERRNTAITLSPDAQTRWQEIYEDLTRDHPGVLGVVTSRAEAQVLRLAMTFALLDCADSVEKWHVEAAVKFWRYAFDSAHYVFGEAEADPMAETVLKALADGPKSQTEIWNRLGRHGDRKQVVAVLADLQDRGRATLEKVSTKGRPRMVWKLAA